MNKSGMTDGSKALRKVMLQSAIIILLSAAQAGAQTDGAANIKASRPVRDAPVYREKVPTSILQRYEKEGIVVEFSMKSIPDAAGKDEGLVAGADAFVSFRLSDKRTGEPVAGLHPNAWLNARSSPRSPNEAECKDNIKAFMGGLISVRPDIDLNTYFVVTLNHDNTVTFINPQVSFNITKLESIITLPGSGIDWALSQDRNFLYITMPDQSAVAVINVVTRKIAGAIPTGEKTRPVRIALQPDGKYVWVGMDGSALVAVIDAHAGKLVGTLPAGEGLHTIAFTRDSRFAYVTNSASNTVSVFDTRNLSKVTDIAVGKTPVAIAHSRASDSIYVSAINDGTVSVISPAKQAVVKSIALKRGIVALKFDPRGRYGFSVNQIESVLSVIDAATDSVIGSAPVVKGADQVAFTEGYAYIRGTESEKFSLIELSEVINRKEIRPAQIQAGQKAPNALPEEIGVADMIVPTPEGNSVMIGNTAESMVYYYAEGMMAPMGTFQNYKRRPHALLLIDRSLAETAPGVYSSPIKLKRSGMFDVAMLIDQPRIVNCFEAHIAQSPDGERLKPVTSVTIEALFKGSRFKPGERVGMKFKVMDSATGLPLKGLRDVSVLVFEPPGIWQQRQGAREVGEGVYEVAQRFPRSALYYVLVKIPSRGLRFADLPQTNVSVVEQQ